MPRQFESSRAILKGLIRVASLDAQVRKIDEDAATATGGEIAVQRNSEGCLGEVESAEPGVAGTALLGDTGAVEPEPAAIVEFTAEPVDCFGVIKGSVARIEIT